MFTTRSWRLGSARQPAAADAWREVADAMDVQADQLRRVRQVHGADVVVQRARAPVIGTPDADIILSDDPSVAIAVQTADCVPLLMADARTGAVAAAHAGWRGLALGVPSAAVAAMARVFDSRASELVAAIGPSIGCCCYEVGDEVRQRFEAAGFSGVDLRRWFAAEPGASPANPSMPQLLKVARPGRWFFDVWAAACDQLKAAGVAPGRIFAARLCTASHADAFCSYRRDGAAAGRLAAAIRTTQRSPSGD